MTRIQNSEAGIQHPDPISPTSPNYDFYSHARRSEF